MVALRQVYGHNIIGECHRNQNMFVCVYRLSVNHHYIHRFRTERKIQQQLCEWEKRTMLGVLFVYVCVRVCSDSSVFFARAPHHTETHLIGHRRIRECMVDRDTRSHIRRSCWLHKWWYASWYAQCTHKCSSNQILFLPTTQTHTHRVSGALLSPYRMLLKMYNVARLTIDTRIEDRLLSHKYK